MSPRAPDRRPTAGSPRPPRAPRPRDTPQRLDALTRRPAARGCGSLPRRAPRPRESNAERLAGWWTHGLPPQLVNRGRRHAAHRGGFRRPSHVRATPPCRRPAPTGCGCASPRSGGDHLRHAHPPALAGGRLHPVAQGGGHLVEPRGREPGDGPRVSHRPAPQCARPQVRDQRYHRGEDRADARGETTVGG